MVETELPERTTGYPVLVIGAAGLDVVGRLKTIPPAALIQSRNTKQAGIRVSFGGVGRNVAENLARLGQPVRLMSAFGKDNLGKQLLSHTAACGVDVSACIESDRFLTSSYLAVLDVDGARYLALEDMEVLEEITPALLRQHKDLIAHSDLVFIDANLSGKALKSVVSMANRAKVPICADATSVLLAERLIPFLDRFYLISGNSAEATVLCQNNPIITDQETALQAARQLVNRGVKLAVISLAESGVVYATSETSGHTPAVRTRVLDPTGAGDALTATVIFGLLNKIPIDESIRLGVTAASLILRHRGTVLPNLSLEKLYDELLV